MQEIQFFPPRHEGSLFLQIIKESTVSSNVSSIFETNVLMVLESHRNIMHKKFQAAVLNHIQVTENDHVFVECSSEDSLSNMQNLVLTKIPPQCLKGWDIPEVTPLLSQFKQIRNPVYEAIVDLSLQKKIQWNKSIQKLVMVYNIMHPKSPIEPLGVMHMLVYGFEEEIAEMKKRLIATGEKWLIRSVSHFNESLFPLRHQSLINAIKESTAKRAILFSGESHADSERSIFPHKVEELKVELSSKAYMILNPNRLDEERLENFIST